LKGKFYLNLNWQQRAEPTYNGCPKNKEQAKKNKTRLKGCGFAGNLEMEVVWRGRFNFSKAIKP
jgi:metal-sulfur cluster biosynthetic enzyme